MAITTANVTHFAILKPGFLTPMSVRRRARPSQMPVNPHHGKDVEIRRDSLSQSNNCLHTLIWNSHAGPAIDALLLRWLHVPKSDAETMATRFTIESSAIMRSESDSCQPQIAIPSVMSSHNVVAAQTVTFDCRDGAHGVRSVCDKGYTNRQSQCYPENPDLRSENQRTADGGESIAPFPAHESEPSKAPEDVVNHRPNRSTGDRSHPTDARKICSIDVAHGLPQVSRRDYAEGTRLTNASQSRLH